MPDLTRSLRAVAALAVAGQALCSQAYADAGALDRCGGETADRLRFVEERLEERRSYADWWWKGWTGFYGVGAVVSGVQAGVEDDGGRRADYIVSAVKATFGTTRLWFFPPTARVGTAPLPAIDPADERACRERLTVGEELLRKTAKESRSRWSWKRHGANLGLNLAGGLVVAEGFDEPRGWRSAGIGFAVGEAMILSHPWQADDDLAEYERRFARIPAPEPVSWRVAPFYGGLRVLVSF